MTDVIPCVLSKNTAQMFIYLQLVPWAFSGFMFALNLVLSGSVFFYYVSLWLGFSHYSLYPFQDFFNMIRPEILCALGEETYKFPSVVMYYVGSAVTIILVYALLWPTRTSYIRWFWVALLVLAPAFALTWFHFNVWYEVLFSFLWSAVMTIGFMLLLRFYLAPAWPYMECVPPFTWMGLHDRGGWLNPLTTEFLAKRKQIRIDAGVWSEEDEELHRHGVAELNLAKTSPNQGHAHWRWWHIVT